MAARPAQTKSALRVLASSEGLDPGALQPGHDLVVHAPRGHGHDLVEGVLIDDHLSVAQRRAIDVEAGEQLSAWRSVRDAALTVGGVCLPYVHEIELFVDVFLREVRAVRGLALALKALGAARVVLEAFDHELAECAMALGHAEVERRDGSGVPGYPIGFKAPPAQGPRAAVSRLREGAGIRGRARGDVLILPWWNLEPLWDAAEGRGLRPVLEPLRLPDGPRLQLLRHAARGGWISQPGARARRRSREAALGALRAAYADVPAGDPLAVLLDRRALRLLEQRALDSPARAWNVERDFARGSLRTAVSPSDATPDSRAIAWAAGRAGRSIVHVQHGFVAIRPGDGEAPPSYVDGMVAGQVGTWSEDYASYLAKGAPGRVAATGSPAGSALAPGARLAPGAHGAATLLLVELPTHLSSIAGTRVTARHLEAALTALAAVRPGSRVIARPHPLDREQGLWKAAAARHPGLELSLDATTPIDALFEAIDLCVGTISTATLQAAAAGVPAVLLDVTEARLSWPFEGSGAFPVARDAEALAAEMAAALEAAEPAGADAALVALGADPRAVENVLDLIGEAARS